MQHIHHIQNGADMTIGCVLLMTCNNMIGLLQVSCNSLAGWLSSFGIMQWLQIVGILASIVASCYVAYNQHLNIRWKRRQDKLPMSDKQKRNDDGGKH